MSSPRRTAALTRAQVDRFRADGVLIIEGAFSASEIAALSDAMDRLYARADGLDQTATVDGARFVLDRTGPGGAPRVQRVVWCGAAEPELARLGNDPRIVGPAAQLLGVDEVDQLVHQAHFKHPGDGVAFAFHQDAWNRRYGTKLWTDEHPDGGYVQVVLTVDPMTEDNGPLCQVPRSHELGPLLGDDRDAQVAEALAARPPQPILTGAGSLVLFGPFLVHGSAPNSSPRPRRIVVNGFCRPGVNRRRYHGVGLGLRRVVGR